MSRARALLTPLLAAAFALASLTGAAPAPKAAFRFPDTGPGRVARAWFEAYAAPTDSAMSVFLATRVAPPSLEERPMDVRLRAYHRMLADMGRLTPARVVSSGGTSIAIEAGSETGESVTLTFQCEASPPGRLTGLRIEVEGGGGSGVRAGGRPGSPGDAGGGAGPAALPRDAAAFAAALGARLDSLSRAGAFSGAVLVSKGGTPQFRRAYGLADRREARPNRPDTKFNLGSINKLFTKIAIAQLAQEGRLRPEDTIDRYLPDYPRAAASRITIAQLVEHRAGVGDIFGPRYAAMDKSKLRRVSDWIPLFRDEPLRFEPGTKREYSNGGYVLLGAIVEQVSGRDYYDYVRARIYRPAGMTDTDHFASDDPVENLARGYTRRADVEGKDDGTGLRDNAPTRPWRGSPAGGGYSTVDDLDRLVRALRGGRLLDAKWTEWAVGDAGAIGVAGGAPGINATLDTDGPYTVVVLANLDPPAAERVAQWIRGALTNARAGSR